MYLKPHSRGPNANRSSLLSSFRNDKPDQLGRQGNHDARDILMDAWLQEFPPNDFNVNQTTGFYKPVWLCHKVLQVSQTASFSFLDHFLSLKRNLPEVQATEPVPSHEHCSGAVFPLS